MNGYGQIWVAEMKCGDGQWLSCPEAAKYTREEVRAVVRRAKLQNGNTYRIRQYQRVEPRRKGKR